MTVLICDDEENIRKVMKRFLALEGIDSDTTENGLSAQRCLTEKGYDAVLVDLRMPGMDGLSLIRWMRAEGFRMPVLMMSAFGEISDAVEALKCGAQDYIVKPFDPEEVVVKIKELVDASNLSAAVESPDTSPSFIGESPEMLHIKGLIKKVAPTMATVLITGESGTGKEVVAREIHRLSALASGPFIGINLGGVPDNLLESELFGYEKGAFTGATQRKTGLFELASGGTLFLDEIGDMPLPLQVKLLRVLQERKIMRLGGTVQMDLDARIIAATNKNLESMVREGTFREDLFYRLNVVRIELPPLRERRDDIPLLAGSIIRKFNQAMGTSITGFSPEALSILKSHPFYGNIRELENVIERAVLFADGNIVEPENLFLQQVVQRPESVSDAHALEEPRTLKEVERTAIINALHRWEGNRTRAAEELGISRRTLITKISEYGIDI